MIDEIKDRVFRIIQTYLKIPPTIIWGSGATVSLGLPTMEALYAALREGVEGFSGNEKNLEIELAKSEHENQMTIIKRVIWDTICEADEKVLLKFINTDTDDLDGIKSMIEKFIAVHPKVVNIITTNYDRVLEHLMSYYGIPFTDGFEGKELSQFDTCLFQDKSKSNLIKVHGSLNWFKVGSRIRYFKQKNAASEPIIICPGKNKYQEAYQTPYRELIQRADELITSASSFLIVGFGFNDEHLTPKIKEKVENSTPLVLITKKITDSCFLQLKDVQKYVLLQEGEAENTVIFMKTSRDNEVEKLSVDGDFWKLNKFMEIL